MRTPTALLALAFAAPLALGACGEPAQEDVTTERADEPAETQTLAQPDAPAEPPAETQTLAQPEAPMAEAPAEMAETPAGMEAQAPDERELAQVPPAMTPERVPDQIDMTGQWGEDLQMCQAEPWVVTPERVHMGDRAMCEVHATETHEEGIDLGLVCTVDGEAQETALSFAFPNFPDTDAMVVQGDLASEEVALVRCPPPG